MKKMIDNYGEIAGAIGASAALFGCIVALYNLIKSVSVIA